MEITVTKEHLQYPINMMYNFLPFPKLFFADSDIFVAHFKLLDRKATLNEALKKGLDWIEPSCFGATVVSFADDTFSDSFVNLPGVSRLIREVYKDSDATIQARIRGAMPNLPNLSLNLAALYILPLYRARNAQCPYMPAPWIANFMYEKEKFNTLELRIYFKNIFLTLARICEEKLWLIPYIELAGQLGTRGVRNLLISIAMFLEAHETSGESAINPARPPAEIISKHTEIPPNIIKSLKDMNLDL